CVINVLRFTSNHRQIAPHDHNTLTLQYLGGKISSMCNYQRHLFFILSLVSGGALTGMIAVSAQQSQQAPQPQKPTQNPVKPANNDEPVAVTERVKVEKKTAAKEITDEQFGTFRYPIINNKGDIAFLAFFTTPASKSGSDQAVFVKKADGSWKVIRRGEKASNQPDPITTFGSVPAFNDNGDLTFVAEFELAASKPAPVASAIDPLDPMGGQVQSPAMNRGLYIKTAEGLKSLAKFGEEVPNMPSHFSGFANASTNSKGVTAFIGTYTDPDGRGLFLAEEGKKRIIVRSGQRVGNGIEGVFSEHYYPTPINERGEVA